MAFAGRSAFWMVAITRRGRHEQRHDDEHRDDRPCEFDLIAAVDLWRLAIVVVRPVSESHDGVNQEAEHDHEYDGGDSKHEQGQSMDRMGWRGDGREDVRRVCRRHTGIG